jgi:hypothetical protein
MRSDVSYINKPECHSPSLEDWATRCLLNSHVHAMADWIGSVQTTECDMDPSHSFQAHLTPRMEINALAGNLIIPRD